jgi:hypothetical protein
MEIPLVYILENVVEIWDFPPPIELVGFHAVLPFTKIFSKLRYFLGLPIFS